MDVARCTEDGHTYEAVEFSQLPPIELARKRRLLCCPECNGPAFFRKASRSGRAACFGARPHAGGCGLAAPEHDVQPDGQGTDQDALNNPGGRIVVDFNYGAQEQPEHEEAPGLPRNPNRRGRFVGEGDRPDARMHRRLSTLLRNLVEAPNFSQSDQLLEIEGRDEIAVRDFFVPLDAVSEEHARMYRGFWGMISDARFAADGTLWLNSGGRDDVSFCVDEEHVDAIYDRYGVDDEEDIAGAYVLVFGTLRVSQNGKLYCLVTNPGYMALRLAD